ncbi:zinc-binding alcohol dehydrogenase domain-containing protein cipB [Acrasis kona]|uniref:Zinc-binding alcohol dehydrogenase domain-containing protein cipB n=1 Tax=Acrasis kona TaxID=1008807 RepID=A0AAW2ZLD8_9EUKA
MVKDVTHSNVTVKFVESFVLLNNKEFGGWLFGEYIPKALEHGTLVPNKVKLVDGGLGGIQDALDAYAEHGVSGEKIVLRVTE